MFVKGIDEVGLVKFVDGLLFFILKLMDWVSYKKKESDLFLFELGVKLINFYWVYCLKS